MIDPSRSAVAGLLLVLVLGACGAVERADPSPGATGAAESAAPPSEPGEWTRLAIAQGTQGSAGDLSIGMVGVSRRERMSGADASERQLVATLQLTLRTEPARTERRSVQAGEWFEVFGYRVFVTEVREGGILRSVLSAPGSSAGEGVVLYIDATSAP